MQSRASLADAPEARRAGARAKVELQRPEELVHLRTLDPKATQIRLREEADNPPMPARPHLGAGPGAREHLRIEYVLARLAQGTRHGYGVGWRQWCLFNRARGRGPLLLGG